ncbi:MAG: hypothetical protein MMC33_000588 [Icmadophila ericetorum]|nr:hypothetical protein [Icmadophila ericetorum]
MASFLQCNDGREFACIQNNCLGSLILPATCLISLLLFFLSYFRRRRYQYRLYGFKQGSPSAEEVPDISVPGQYITAISPLVIALEILGLLADIITGIVLLLHEKAPQDCPLAFTSVLFSVYLLLLLAGRSYSAEFRLQPHSVGLYAVQWLYTALITRAMFVEESGWFRCIAILIRLAIFTTLCLLHCIAPRVPTQTSYRGDKLSSTPGRDETASLLSRLTFFWINALVWKAFRRTLEASDLYQLNRNQTSAVLAPRFRAAAAATLPLLWRIYHFFKYDFLKQGVWAAVMSIAVFIPPMLMRLILQYLESQDGMTRSTAWFCVSGLLISGLLASFADCQCNWIGRKISAKLRTVLISEIYAKVLRKSIARPLQAKIKPDSDKGTDTEAHASDGNILNLISVDAEVISEMSWSLYLVWVTFPVQTTIGTYLLYRILGLSGVIGVMLMIALLPLNILVSKRMMAVQGHVLAASDARIQASNELLHNIRTIKYCAWEVPFRERVLERRGSEIERMRSRFIWWSISMTLFYSLPFIVTLLTCFFYTIVWGNDLGTSIAFPALAIFALLRIPLNRMADSIAFLLQAHVSLQRISKFLKERETGKHIQLLNSDTSFIGFDDTTLVWPSSRSKNCSENDGSIPLAEMLSTQPFRLHSLRIEFQQDALNIVCGPSGSGKSSLLLALLGEMDIIRGRVFLPHKETGVDLTGLQNSTRCLSATTAYCPQEPWIMNRSIRANILIGLPFNGHRYETVLHAVALLQDLAALDQGDQTLAGENGSRLSGGQKQRVALARALYSHSKYVLLDDCLSAVDSHTVNHIFFNAIKGPLMRGRTCILATHHTQLAIPHCKQIVILDAGQVIAQGTGEELVSAGFIGADMMEGKAETPPTASWDEKFTEVPKLASGAGRLSSKSSYLETETLRSDFRPEMSETKLDYEESKSEGAVPWSVVQTYLVAMGSGWYWIIVLLGFAAQQLASLGTVLWIKEWAFQYDKSKLELAMVSGPPIDDVSKSEGVVAWYYLIIYLTIGISYALITLLRDLLVFSGSLKASSRIYERLLSSILYAKLLFFDRVPLGQITNRLSRDVEVLDQSLATFSVSAFQIAGTLAMIVVLISIVLPAFLLVAFIIFLAYSCVTAVYISGARDLKRIEAVERSPLYQQFGETLAGCVSIRAYARTSTFTAQNYSLVDRLSQPYLLIWASKEWMTFRIGILSSMISFSTGTFVLWNLDSINPGAAGLVLTYAATFTENLLWLVQIYAIIQQNLNSVERIVEYTEVEREAAKPPKTASQYLPYNWPSQGVVRFHDYTTRYAPELEPTLKGISFDVRAGERVAIVGRTGAGKSTLTLALIRGLEASGGHIEIDGIDVASVPLRKLRQVVTIVPQDPKLFDGSLRDNLAPLHRHKDDEMLEAVRAVRLLGTTDPALITYSDLDRPADTLSRGQCQLLCIARGLLRRSRVLVLDEATASVDHATDVAIQAGLRASIAAGTTVLTIAHRLLTIADYDRIVLLDAGRVVEQGSIRDLLGRRGESAMFRRLCEESGDIEEIERAAAFSLGIEKRAN